MYYFAYILHNDLVLTITDKVGLWQKLSEIDTVIGVTLTGFHFYFLHSELLTIYQV